MIRKAGEKIKFKREILNAAKAIWEKRGSNLVVLDLRGISSFTDYFVICEGTSTRQTQAISDAVREELKKDHIIPSHIEGYSQGNWILIDYIDFIVNIFLPQTRKFYELERLWGDAAEIKIGEKSGGHTPKKKSHDRRAPSV